MKLDFGRFVFLPPSSSLAIIPSCAFSLLPFSLQSFVEDTRFIKSQSLLHTSIHSFITSLFYQSIATMKSALTAGLVASALLLQQAAGTGSWGEAPSFSSPSNCNNTCNIDQQSGFDWSSLPAGGFSSYGGFGFSGFTCQNSFQGKSKRSLQARSGFQVSMAVYDEAGYC
jgi:hypothetical protein